MKGRVTQRKKGRDIMRKFSICWFTLDQAGTGVNWSRLHSYCKNGWQGSMNTKLDRKGSKPRLEPAPIWSTSTAGTSLTYHALLPSLKFRVRVSLQNVLISKSLPSVPVEQHTPFPLHSAYCVCL